MDPRGSTARQTQARGWCQPWLMLTVVALTVMLLPPADVEAGFYVVHSCRLPDGSPASTDGWHAESEADVVTPDGCAGGGSLSIAFRPGTQPNTRFVGSWGKWVFDAPPDTRVSAYSIFRSVKVHTVSSPPEASEYKHYVDNHVWQWNRDYCNPTVCRQRGDNPGVPRDPANLVRAEGVDVGRLGFLIECWRSDGGEGCPSWWEPVVHIYAADVTLRDPHAPAVIGLAGDLAGEIDGTRPVVVRALDRGGGLQQARLEVDGVVVAEQPFDPARATCSRPYPTPVPCPLSGESRVPLDTSKLADGQHQLRAWVSDAAGNDASSTTYAIDVDNAGATCAHGHTATLRARFRRNKLTRLRTRAGRTVAITGRLRGADGNAVGGAAIRVLVRARHRQDFRESKVITTGKRGRFQLAIRANSSQRVRLSYCEVGGGAVRHLHLVAEASSRIGATRHVLMNGQSVVLFGRLKGAPVPSNGKLIEIQAFFRNRWRTISSVRSNRRGMWRFRYRFDGTQGTVAYRFRAFLPEETGYPYASGKSRVIRLVVTGR
jgi:hypothetical protein